MTPHERSIAQALARRPAGQPGRHRACELGALAQELDLSPHVVRSWLVEMHLAGWCRQTGHDRWYLTALGSRRLAAETIAPSGEVARRTGPSATPVMDPLEVQLDVLDALADGQPRDVHAVAALVGLQQRECQRHLNDLAEQQRITSRRTGEVMLWNITRRGYERLLNPPDRSAEGVWAQRRDDAARLAERQRAATRARIEHVMGGRS